MKQRIKYWFIQKWMNLRQSRKQQVILALAFILILALGIAIYQRYFVQDEAPVVTEEVIVEEPPVFYSTMDGTEVAEELHNRIPLALIIENHPDARPQIALGEASAVYEAIAEGGITRFLALYQHNDPQKIGPIRSARQYFVSWAQEWRALFGHVGGSSDSLEMLRASSLVYDLDQFSVAGAAYDRDRSRRVATEHTMFTNSAKLRDVARNRNHPQLAQFVANTFKEDTDTALRPISQTLNINYSTNTYNVRWVYNPQTNSYLREMAGSAHVDGVSQKQIEAKNIVIQNVARRSKGSAAAGWLYTTVGEGRATFVQDGQAIEATWKRPDEGSRTKFFDTAGNEIAYNRGATWYQIVHPELKVTIE